MCGGMFRMDFFVLGKPSAYGSARLGHIPSLPGKPQLPLKPCISLQPFYFKRQLRFLRFSLRFQCYLINTSVKGDSLSPLTISLRRAEPARPQFACGDIQMVSLLDKTSDLCYIFHDFQSNSDERSVLHAFLFPQKAHPTAAGRLHTGTNPNRIQHLHRRNHHWFLRCCRKEITICGTGKNTSRHCRFLCTIWAHTA